MKLYLSGSLVQSDYIVIEHALQLGVYRLCTFAYPREAFVYLDAASNLGCRAKMMIDSGAFTAWSGGKPVNIKKLITYSQRLVSEYGDKHDFVFISLDVMPGKRGEEPTRQQLKDSMRQSYENYIEYKEALDGYTVIPVYHSGEPLSLRDLYLKHTDHICLSMNQAMGEKDRVAWASRVQLPGIKLHGLAATGVQMIRYVDWYSVDSASWIMASAMGNIYWSTEKGIITLPISDQSPKRKKAGAHAATLPSTEEIKEIIKSKGFVFEELQTHHHPRMMWNMETWYSHNWRRTPIVSGDLFGDI